MDYAKKGKNNIIHQWFYFFRQNDFTSATSRKTSQPTARSLNQNGSVLITLVSFLPIMISSLMATWGICWFLMQKNDLLFICEKGVLKSQNILVQAENSLISLNKPIQSLVVQKKLLQKALLVAKTPVEISMIQARLVVIEIKLSLLHKKQIFLHTSANTRASHALQFTSLELKKLMNQSRNIWSSQSQAAAFAKPALIQLQTLRIDPSAQIYQTPVNFIQKQTLTVKSSLTGSSLFPRWIRFLHETRFFWKESCSSRPFLKENNKWTSELAVAKL